jgi:amino acid adenylation domain-containing protein/non-ribosomal peptide synthase protein (TIGR01720 family)
MIEGGFGLKSEQQVQERSHHLFNLSARSEQAVRQAALKLSQHLDREPDVRLADLAYTLHVGRKQFDHRLNLVAASHEELRELCLQAAETPLEHGQAFGGISYRHYTEKRAPKVAFLFTGQGNQYTGMGQELYESSSVFRDAVDACVEILEPLYPIPFRQYLFNPQYKEELDLIYISTPAMFVLEYAVAKLWMSWGVVPDLVLGHSFGEYVASCISGAMTLQEALPLVVMRGRLMHEGMEPGGMLSVLAEPEAVAAFLEPYQEHLSIATQNGPTSFVISGRVQALEELTAQLEREQVVHKRLPISVAGHSPLMDPIVAPLKEHIEKHIQFQPLTIPLISNLTAEVLAHHVLDAEYWGRHMREPVLFSRGVDALVEQGVTVFVEIGPHPVLKTMVEAIIGDGHCVLGSLSRKESHWKTIQGSLGQLAAAGVAVDWKAFDADYKRRRVHAPTYPFERKSYWISLSQTGAQAPTLVVNNQIAATAEAPALTPAGRPVVSNRPTDELMATFWKEVLGISKVEADDHFLTLGGDSLMMIQIKSRIKKSLQLDVPIKDVFLHPKFSDFVAHIDNLRQEALGEENSDVPPAEVKEHYPLSHTQRRLWFLYKFNPESTVYNMPSHYVLKGDVRPEWLEAAIQYLVDRHSALRTVFTEIEGKAYQVVRPSLKFTLHYEDGSDLSSDVQLEYGMSKIMRDQDTPFDLTAGPLFRAMLFKMSADEYHFYLNQHHIITDGWSLDLFREELLHAYEAIAKGQAPALKKPVQYIDYVEWYEREAAAGRWEKEEQYWLQTLAHPLPAFNLPTDFPRPEIQTFAGSMYRLIPDQDLLRQVREFAQREGASMYMITLAAFKMLLRHLSQENEVIVGTPVMGRTVQALESVMGFFANSLAIRTRMADVRTLRDLLRQVTSQSLDAFEHQSYPFDRLVDQLNLERDMSRSPIFTTFFTHRYAGGGEQSADQVIQFTAPSEERRGLGHNISKFDLTLTVDGKDETDIHLLFEYNTDLFLPETVERFALCYHKILEAFVQQAEAPLAEIDLLLDAEHEMYRALNDTGAAFPEELTIPELFYAQAELHGEKPALSDAAQSLSYRELNERSNQWAHELRKRGVGKESIVGIVMERGIPAVLAILAVLKAGGAYVPIDPKYPEARVRYMIEDSGALLLFSHRQAIEALGLQDNDNLLLVEELASDLPTDNLDIVTKAHDLAYMIYTSGSTGTPKGTELHHVGVSNLSQWKLDRFGYSPEDTILQFASFSFDASVWEMFPALLNGAHLHLLSDEQRQSVEEFAAVVEQTQATTVTLPTVFFNQLSLHLLDNDLRKFKTMKRIFVAGEALQGEVVRAWQRRFGQRVLIINAYGPTESTVCATTYSIDHVVPADQTYIPIGTPIANTRIFILGQDLKPCPVNVVGELHIESVGLARGYRNQPERTQQAFIPHPLSAEPGAVLYKSGDMARMLPDGTIEFIGRRDDQVKIRGHRIEIGEIEEHLLKLPEIEDGAVVAQKLTNGTYQLIAFCTAHAEQEVETAAVRAVLASQLPDYMVPAQIVCLDEMPLTPNGKIDRKKLLTFDVRVELASYTPPQTPLEEKIAYAWEKCLYRENVSIHDNFFSVGGDSIISMQVVSVLNREGLRVKTPDLFKHQTIAELARHVEANALYVDESAEKEAPVVGVVPLGPIQQHLFELENTDHEYYLLALILDIVKGIDPELLQQAIDVLIDHHDMLRATYTFDETGAVIQTILHPDEAHLDLQVFDYPEMDHEEVLRECARVEAELKAQVKFADGLVMKAALLRFGDNKCRLIWAIHHLITDMVSSRILTTDLINLYESLAQGEQARLPHKSGTYEAWVRSSIEQINGAEGERAYSYWKPFLEVAGDLTVPVDNPEGSNLISDGQELFVNINETLTTQLLTEVTERHSTSIKEVLLTTMLRAVASWTGQEWVGLATEGHGRDQISETEGVDLERTIGWFTSVYPFYAQIGQEQPVHESVAQVVQNLSELPHGGASFNMLRYLSEEPEVREKFASFTMPEICYNFFGQYDNMRSLTLDWSPGQAFVENHPSDSENHFDILIRGRIRNGILQMGFQFSEQRYRRENIERLMKLFESEIHQIVATPKTY